MTEDRDPFLQSLFDDSRLEPVSEEFTSAVVSRTYSLRNKLITVAVGLIVILLVYTWFYGAPGQGLALAMAKFLSTSLIDLGNSWAALILAPINSIAGLLAITFKLLRSFSKKILGL